MKIKVIIVDDEPRAHYVLENYISRVPELSLAGTFLNASLALDYLKGHDVDLVLLDITMPELDGFTFLQKVDHPPLIIFTTAHSEYALESYSYDAVDYLKKPISFERFLKAIHKAMGFLHRREKPVSSDIELKVDGELMKLPFENILYFQSLGNYIKVHTTEKIRVSQITTHEIEEALPKEIFIRIHKSYIVNRSKIERLTEDELVVSGVKLPIGKTFKRYVKDAMAAVS